MGGFALHAGPIVRRVEPRQVSVWVAVNESCTVQLRVWPGPEAAGDGTGGVFDPGGDVLRGERQTLRIGANLHIAVVTARTTPSAQPLLPGERYSYNVIFKIPGDTPQDLATMGLLKDTDIQPCLGYQSGLLPSFATCPASIDDLVMLHGSCNRIHAAGGPNLMFAIDELVQQNVDLPRARPHQLWLTGDQVYADEVPATLSSRITALGRELLGTEEYLSFGPVGGSQTLKIKLSSASFPGAYRKVLVRHNARLTTTEGDSHLLGLSERLAMQLLLWSPHVWERDDHGAIRLDDPKTLVPRPPPTAPASGSDEDKFLANYVVLPKDIVDKVARQTADEVPLVRAYAERVGRIRRGLANVATYMVFDDHDVTDDWNICQLWKDRVYGNLLGRSIVRDGLVCFALTQGWGNAPDYYDTGVAAQLLTHAAELFPDGVTEGPDEQAVAALDSILGLGGQPPQMQWNFKIDGATHRVIACDTRTRRGFTGLVSPPVQLPDVERDTQIPEGPAEAGIEMVMVVLSQPALDPVLFGELTQGLISRGVSAMAGINYSMHIEDQLEAGYGDVSESVAVQIHGLEALDYEGWSARPAEMVRLLERLATYNRVMILSGDVHFAVTLGSWIWTNGTHAPLARGWISVIGQFTSSAVQYITFPEVVVPIMGQGWVSDLLGRGYPADYLVWHDPDEEPVKPPRLPPRAMRRAMLQRPVILPAGGWEAPVDFVPPDFALRLELARDPRLDEQRPEPVRPEKLTGDFDPSDAMHGPHGYGELSRRHQNASRKHSNTRTLGMFNKIAKLSFRRNPDQALVACSELYSIDHFNATTLPPEPFTLHEIVYDIPAGTSDPTVHN